MELIENLLKSEPLATSSQKIYAANCHRREVTELPVLLKDLEAILVDIRFVPESHPLEWSKEYLKLLLRNKYLHVPSLGNRGSKDGKIAIQNLALGIKIITDLKVNVLLMCKCKNEETCHRFTILNEFKKYGIEVGDLEY